MTRQERLNLLTIILAALVLIIAASYGAGYFQ